MQKHCVVKSPLLYGAVIPVEMLQDCHSFVEHV